MKDKTEIRYINGGNLCSPELQEGNNILLHCCNDIPTMGAGVAKALYTQWPQVREQYMLWKKMTVERVHSEEEVTGEIYGEKYQYHFPNPSCRRFSLGNVQFVAVDVDGKQALVGNMIGQHNIYNSKRFDIAPVRYDAFNQAFTLINQMAEVSEVRITIHVPYLMGCDLAGGDWVIIEQLMQTKLLNCNLLAYDLFGKYDGYVN